MRKGRLARTAVTMFAAALPLCIVGCQDQGRSDSMPNGTPRENTAQRNEPTAAKLDDTTKTNILLRQLHASNQEEIDLGKLAEDKAQNADVKKFAADMVNDHTAADQKLVDLTKRLNIDISGSPTDPVQKALSSAGDECKKSLRGMSGAPFDVAYFAPQVDKYTFALKVIDEAKSNASGDVKNLLDEMRPTVERHLEHAKDISRGLGFTTAVGGGPTAHEHEAAAPGGTPSRGVTGGKDAGHREMTPKAAPKPE